MITLDEVRQQAPALFTAATSAAAGELGGCELRAGGEKISKARRDELLAKVRAGEQVDLEMDVLAFEQKPGERNRNSVRFRDGAMVALGRSGKGTPFLRDHEQGDVRARGGTVTASRTEKVGEGHYQIWQTVNLTSPWAVEAALLGNLTFVSIGWSPTGDVLCSACNKPVLATCWHFPGDRLRESDEGERGKRLVRDRSGDIVVEWIYTSADLVETSGVSVPAVPTAQIEGIRASLSASALNNGGLRPQENLMHKLATIATMLGLAATASEDEVGTAVTKLVGERDTLKKELAIVEADRKTLAAEVDTYRAGEAKRQEDDFIAAALSEGRITAGEDGVWRELFQASADRARIRMAERKPGSRTPVGLKRQTEDPPPDHVPVEIASSVDEEIRNQGATTDGVKKVLKQMGHKDPAKIIEKHGAKAFGLEEQE
jgi:hypothetical protein